MSRLPRSLSIRPAIAAALLASSAVLGATGAVALADRSASEQGVLSPAVEPFAGKRAPGSLADMVEAVGPSVVQIKVRKVVGAQRMAMPFGDDGDGGEGGPFSGQMRDFFGFGQRGGGFGPQAPQEQSALGSGFIIDPSGIVLTNNHVVEGAREVTVQLSDGREFKGTVLGTDPKTDLGVVRINGGGSFKPIRWGDSDHVRVGDSVFAVGSPFGLGNTVTAGIVSARSRDIGEGPYDDFLQVDAAINSGNSGGPLFDGSGRVVGVNTAIFSPSGGNVGIGFAIPGRMAQRVAEQIVARGSVARGHIGVSLQGVTPDIADAMGLKTPDGALIAAVEEGSPAAASGLKQGDVVRSFGGVAVKDSKALARMVADARSGSSVPVSVIRDGRAVSLELRIGRDRQAQVS